MAMETEGGIQRRWRGAGYGAVIGGLVGFGLSQGSRQYQGTDVAAFAAVGSAIGASPTGAGIGFGVGAAIGSLAWLASPKLTVGDAVAVSLAGLAVGGLAGWVAGADRADSGSPTIVIPLEIRF